MADEFYTVKEIAEELKVKPRVIRGVIKRLHIKVVKVGKELRVPKDGYMKIRNGD